MKYLMKECFRLGLIVSYCKCSNAHILIEYTSLVITVWSFSSRALSTLKLISFCLVKLTIGILAQIDKEQANDQTPL